jgi:hypothetical protein
MMADFKGAKPRVNPHKENGKTRCKIVRKSWTNARHHGQRKQFEWEKDGKNETKGLKRTVDLASHEMGLDLRKRFFGLGKEIIPLLLFG